MKHDLREVSSHFQINGDFIEAIPYGSGHINDTYLSTFRQKNSLIHYIHQRINQSVFTDPPSLMENIDRVTKHIRGKLKTAGEIDRNRRCLTLIPTIENNSYHLDQNGNYWRTYIFIEKARTYDVIETTKQASEAARSFGEFQKSLVDLEGPSLHETIPNFHNSPKRLEAFQEALRKDVKNRAITVKPEIAFIEQKADFVNRLLDLHIQGKIPYRITHNDTKLNNVMIDDDTSQGICVIDLDTVMPGLALYDFGDMVRTATSPAPEDEQDLSKVTMRMPIFEALVQGYLSSAKDFLTPTEKSHLVFSGKLMTFELVLRFLMDHLQGDTYFKIHRENHNLDRCRTQVKLIHSIESQEDEMQKIIENL